MFNMRSDINIIFDHRFHVGLIFVISDHQTFDHIFCHRIMTTIEYLLITNYL